MKKIRNLCIILDSFILIVIIAITFFPKSFAATINDDMSNKMEEEYISNIDSSFALDTIINKKDLYKEINHKKSFDNSYNSLIVNKLNENDTYKVIGTAIGGYNAHIVAIYDPSKVKIMTIEQFNTPNNTGKETVTKMCKRLNAVVGINGGGFKEVDLIGYDSPKGYIIKDGKILWKTDETGNLIGMTNDNKLLLVNATGEEAISMGMRDAMEFGPFLIVNGETDPAAKKVLKRRAARTIIAQRTDGIILFVVTEGSSNQGPSFEEIINELYLYGVYNAANLDGGASSQLVVKGELVNTPRNIVNDLVRGGRTVVSGWGLFE